MQGLIQQQVPKQGTSDEGELAVQVIRNTLYDEETAEKLMTVLQNAKDPVIGISKAILIAALPVAKALKEENPDMSDDIWLSPGGVLDRIIDEMMDMAEAAGVDLGDEESVHEGARQAVMQDITKLQQGGVSSDQAPARQPPGLIQGAM